MLLLEPGEHVIGELDHVRGLQVRPGRGEQDTRRNPQPVNGSKRWLRGGSVMLSGAVQELSRMLLLNFRNCRMGTHR